MSETNTMPRVAIIRAKLRWGSREIGRRDIDGEWPDEIEREGFRYRPAGPDHRYASHIERTYYEVIEDDECW